MDRFKGKTALITGGTTGIGLATAKLFINEGARVIVTGRSAATIKSAQAELGDNAIVVRSDATSLPDMDALAAKVKETFGKLDVLFVNAGYGHFIPFEQVTEEVYDEMLNLNAKGPYFIVQKLVPLMPEGGSVVFTTSMANVKAVAPLSAYGAAKAALRSITRSLASELSPRGIRVNAVSPGPIEATDILQKVGMPKEAADQVYVQMAQSVPMKRLGMPEELAKAVAFLAIDATFTTGTSFRWTADGLNSKACTVRDGRLASTTVFIAALDEEANVVVARSLPLRSAKEETSCSSRRSRPAPNSQGEVNCFR